ncbi:MAG: hypothetical protein ACI4PX_06655, partial [Ruminococcus sp.]
TLHEDFDRNIIQAVPTEYHKLISHNGGTAKNMDYLFDADSRTLGSVKRNLNGIESNAPSIYSGADFKLNKSGQNIISEYQQKVKGESMINRIIGNNMQEKLYDTGAKIMQGFNSWATGN